MWERFKVSGKKLEWKLLEVKNLILSGNKRSGREMLFMGLKRFRVRVREISSLICLIRIIKVKFNKNCSGANSHKKRLEVKILKIH